MELGGLYETIVSKNVPFFVTLEVTTRCNNRCSHCYNGDHCELPLDLCKKCIDEAAEMGALFLSLTGGEPLLRKDIWEIISYATERNFATLLYTNATLIGPEEVARLKDLGIYHVDTTLLGTGADTHDSITGIRGSFLKALEAVTLLRDAGISVAVKTPVMKENAAEVGGLKELMNYMGLDHIASPLIFPKDDGDTAPLSHRPDDDQVKNFFSGYDVKDLTERKGAYSCHLGRCTLAVRANGEVTPCICVPFSVGHLEEESLKDIWTKSGRLKEIRENTERPLSECADCRLVDWCFRCEGIAFTESGKLFTSSPELCRMARIRKEVCYDREKK
ncbi:MAG: radical SAM protein [Candidatus Omnitrophota bacterium]